MPDYWSSSTQITDKLIAHCGSVLSETINDGGRRAELDQLGTLASTLEAFVRGYERIDDEDISTDDEILNWVFSEVSVDLSSAIWLLASGFYKASASALRNALDIGAASLYFQLRENENPDRGAYNRFFSEWDRGNSQTPNWGTMKPYISGRRSVARFKENTGVDAVETAYSHFKHLCAFTHSSAFVNGSDPVTAINMTGVAPVFDAAYFTRGCELCSKTVSMIALLWQVAFPGIAGAEPLGVFPNARYLALFPDDAGQLALQHE